MVVSQMITSNFERLHKARVELHNAGEQELAARKALKAAETRILNNTPAKALGANEPARQAHIREITAGEQEALEQAEDAKRKAQLDYDLASMAVDCIKWHIRNEGKGAD